MTKTAITFPIDEPVDAPATVTFWQAFRLWLKLGFIGFGGPAGQISLLHRELVEQRRWISEARFRSEEHTSELQSLMRISYAVFCLKKKTNINTTHII